jgi:chemotaxis protein MotA
MSSKTIAALAAAFAIVAAAIWLGGDFALFFNPAGLLLVIGGTCAGVLLAFPLDTLRGLAAEVRGLAGRRTLGARELGELFSRLARLQRAEGALALEEPAAASGNPFLELGVEMVVDGAEPEAVRERLEQEAEFFFSRRAAQRAVLGLMGRLAPAFGLAGTMIGLIRMLHTLKDPAAVAEGMSVALLTTFYGIMLANLLILPLERKLGELTRAEAVELALITEGAAGLAEGLNGAALSARLRSFRLAEPEGQGERPAAWRPGSAPAAPAGSGGHEL